MLGGLPVVMDVYKLVKFKKGKTEHNIMCTGPSGSSGLAAIINMFTLMFAPLLPEIYEMDEERTKNVVVLLLNNLFPVRYIEDAKKAAVLGVTDHHETHLCVSPTLLGPNNFSSSDARFLFAYLGLKLLHGWVLDPGANIYQSIKSFPRANLSEFLASIQDQEDQKENVLLVQELLQAAQDHQLTEYGFRSLFEEIAEEEFAIVFCYNRFNLVCRHAGKLFMVETDLRVRNRFPDVHWRLFDGSFPEDCIYLKKNYTLVEGHENSAKAMEWIQSGQNLSKVQKKRARKKQTEQKANTTSDDNENSEGNLQSAIGEKQSQVGSENVSEAISSKFETTDQTSEGNLQSAPVEKQSAVDAKNVGEVLPSESGTLTGDSPSRIVGASLTNPDSEDPSGDSPSGSIEGREDLSFEETDKRTEKTEAKIAYDLEFLAFLIEFRHQDIDYFKGILEAFKMIHRPWFFVPYEFIFQQNERLALKIQDNYPRIYEELKESVLEYLKQNGLECPDVKLEILGVPEHKSTQMFQDFVGSINLLELYQVSDSEQEQLPSFDGIRMCLGILKSLVDKFKTGKCWAGKWTDANIRVKNGGSEFVIVECEDVDLNSEDGYADLVTFSTAILKCFANADGQLPPYFDEFGVDCQRFPPDGSDPVKMDRFLELVSCPLAFKPHLVRSTLLCETYVAANSHSTEDPHYLPLAGKNDCKHDLRPTAKKGGVFKKVYEHQKITRSKALRTKYFHDPWQLSHWSVLKYSRVFIQHVLRHTKGHDLAQKIKDIAIVEILLSRKLGKHIAALVRYIVLECGVADGIFSGPWRHYVASECLDKPQGNIGLEGASAIDKILSNDPDEMFAEVYTQLGIPSSEVHKSTVVSDADLTDFESILTKKGIQCQVNQDGTLEINCQVARDGVPQPIRVYKQEGGRSSSSSSFKTIVVEGPYCDEYHLVFEMLRVEGSEKCRGSDKVSGSN